MPRLALVARTAGGLLTAAALLVLASCGGDSSPSDPGGGNPPTASQLAFLGSVQGVEEGETLPAVEVEIRDAQGARVTTANHTVTLALEANPGGATLSGTASVSAVSGVATFSGLSLNAPGSGYTLRATATGLTAVVSGAFDIAPGPLNQDVDQDGFTPNQGDCNDGDDTVNPGADDFPDGGWVDQNCDGIDGDASQSVFVSLTGTDDAGCGGSAAPCRTVMAGIAAAEDGGYRDVYVMGGTYDDGAVILADGVSLYGGFGDGWVRDGTDTTRILGATGVEVTAGASEAATLVANGITQATVVADLEIVGPDATGTQAGGSGKNSYAMWVKDVAGGILTIQRNTVIGGAGAPGAAGAMGQNAALLSATAGMNGAPGGSANQFSTTCDNTSRGMGGAQGSSAAAGRNANGGPGGYGGTMDTDCSNPLNYNLTHRAGFSGANAGYTQSPFGVAGAAGPPCSPGGNGVNGAVTNGPGGTGGTGGLTGSVVGNFWVTPGGTPGGVGQNGGGGGGGGGSGGCDSGTDSYGAGGGGGGAGGQAALGGGGGGGGGGASFGLYLVDASPTVQGNHFVRGAGGNGGDGGVGGQGQLGGTGGLGGSPAGGSGVGGRGGDGGHGGHGGGGGGGAGGLSTGIFQIGTSTPTSAANTYTGGTPGQGGAAGLSAPAAPPAANDGNDGQPGAAGTVMDVASGA